jgi:hypothetical protein
VAQPDQRIHLAADDRSEALQRLTAALAGRVR